MCPTDDRNLLVIVRVHRDGVLRLPVLQDRGQRALSDSHGIRKIRNAERHVRGRHPGSTGGLLQQLQLLCSALLQPRLYGFRSGLFFLYFIT